MTNSRAVLALFLAVVATLMAGCLGENITDGQDPMTPEEAHRSMGVTGVQEWEGTFSGATVAGESFTRQSEGFHWFKVPAGDFSLLFSVAWQSEIPAGVNFSVSRGDGTALAWKDTAVRNFSLEIPSGTLPAGDASFFVRPSSPGAHVDVHYEVRLEFFTQP